MTCTRCKGLLVETWLIDQEGALFVSRCTMCGDVVDGTILEHRGEPMAPVNTGSPRSRVPMVCRMLK